MSERNWAQAYAVLTGVAGDGPGYRDVQGLLQTIREERAQEESLQRLYDQTVDSLETRQWERAYDLLRRIHDLRPDFRDVSALLSGQQRLRDLYEQAMQSMAERRWVEAQTTLRQLEALEPTYKNMASLLERTEKELEAEAQLASAYSQARSRIALEEWEAALELLDQVNDQQEGYRDVPDLIREVRSRILIPCPRCDTPTPSGYKFCSKCGAAIRSWVCWRCQSPVPEDRKFCGKCGASRVKPAAVVCPRCGPENRFGRRFCGKCGLVLTER